MAFRVPASWVEYCRVNLARGCSLLMSRQVRYVVQDFNLQDAMETFDFVFQLHNLASLANRDNGTLQQPFNTLAKLDSCIKELKFPSLSTVGRKRKLRNNDDTGNGPPRKQGTKSGRVEGDTLFDVAILEALECAGYTIPPEDEHFKTLLPVRVSFP